MTCRALAALTLALSAGSGLAACHRAQQSHDSTSTPLAAPAPQSVASNRAESPRAPASGAADNSPQQQGNSRRNVQIQMRRVRLHAEEGIVLQVEQLRGEMVTRAGATPVFDDQSSFTLRISTALVAIDMASLQTLMNKHALAGGKPSLSDLRVEEEGGALKLSGKLHKGLTVPFSARATVAPGGGGTVRLHVESMKAAGVTAKGVMGFFGLELDDLVNLKQTRGIEITDNDITIDPARLLPPPAMQGTLAKVEVSGGRLVETFDDGSRTAALHPPAPSANYIYFHGSDITFGKLTMHEADLQLIDQDPRDPFDFYPAKYSAQLIAGYSKNTPSKGLETFMPDYDDLLRHDPHVAGRPPHKR